MLSKFRAPAAGYAAGLLSLAAAILLPAAAEAMSCQPNCPKPFLPNNQIQSTVPTNGDVNPYGVAFVPANFPTNGKILPGDLLISNFNNVNNLQGTGSTVIKYTPGGGIQPPGNATVFVTTPHLGPGLALGVLQAGYVVVGMTSTTDGTFNTIKSGGLQFYDQNGNPLVAVNTGLNGPWGIAINDLTATQAFAANIFISNVLNGTVSRVNATIQINQRTGNRTLVVGTPVTIATGYTVQPNPGALVLGPAGLAYNPATDTLYVASQLDNAIFAVHPAATASQPVVRGTLIVMNGQLRAPTGLILAPNGDLLTANNDAVNTDMTHPSEIVEYTPAGGLVRQMNVDQAVAGAFGLNFGVGFGANGTQLRFAFVDDNTVTLNLFSCPAAGC